MTPRLPLLERPFYLLTENSLDSDYLIADWLREFRYAKGFRGILLRDVAAQGRFADKLAFQRRHRGRARLTTAELDELLGLYSNTCGYDVMPGLVEALVELDGVPAYPTETAGGELPIEFLGHDPNSPEALAWLEGITARDQHPVVFIFLSRILKRRWIEALDGWLIGVHPAVLPHARGMWAIEQVVMAGDLARVRRCTGASTFFVDAGVDTGGVLEVRGFDPFESTTLPELSARSLRLAGRMLVRAARNLTEYPDERLRGVPMDPALFGPNYKAKDFENPDAVTRAIESFALMRARARGPEGA